MFGRRRSIYGGVNSGRGIGIFYLMLIIFPVFSWFFGFIAWIINHLFLVLIIIFVIGVLVMWINDNRKVEEKIED